MNSDLTFITNEEDKNLLERFKVLIKDTRFFDVLVGYFYTSGFHAIYKLLENTEKLAKLNLQSSCFTCGGKGSTRKLCCKRNQNKKKRLKVAV